jgi:hypothetical protein
MDEMQFNAKQVRAMMAAGTLLSPSSQTLFQAILFAELQSFGWVDALGCVNLF